MVCLSCRDGRLREGDHLLAVDGQLMHSSISHKQAINILQRTTGSIQLIVAHGAQKPAALTRDIKEKVPHADTTSIDWAQTDALADYTSSYITVN